MLLASILMLMTTEPFDMTVVSYNIRYDNLLDGADRWKHRRADLIGAVIDLKPDIIGFQEVLDHQLDELKEGLPGYIVVGVGRDDGKTKGEYSPIFIKAANMKVLEDGTFWYSDTPDKPGSTSWGNSIPRICTWARISCAGGEFIFANTHWDHQSQPSRLKSGQALVSRFPQQRLIVTGDFNVGLTNDALGPFRKAGLRNTWEVANPDVPEPASFTGFKQVDEHGSMIDGVWVTDHFTVITAGLDRRKGGNSYPSDHFPVWAKLRLGN